MLAAVTMTPPITRATMASRPLYNPDPDFFVAREIVLNASMRRVRLSDFAVIALLMNIQLKILTTAQVDIFENVFIRGAKPRAARVFEGEPARAPDGTIMSHGNGIYAGNSEEAAGPWTIYNVSTCPGYPGWMAKITQSAADLIARGADIARKNEPMPDPAALAAANAVVLKKMNIKPGGPEVAEGPAIVGGAAVAAGTAEEGSDDRRGGRPAKRRRTGEKTLPGSAIVPESSRAGGADGTEQAAGDDGGEGGAVADESSVSSDDSSSDSEGTPSARAKHTIQTVGFELTRFVSDVLSSDFTEDERCQLALSMRDEVERTLGTLVEFALKRAGGDGSSSGDEGEDDGAANGDETRAGSDSDGDSGEGTGGGDDAEGDDE
jgi:hypothetical protein